MFCFEGTPKMMVFLLVPVVLLLFAFPLNKSPCGTCSGLGLDHFPHKVNLWRVTCLWRGYPSRSGWEFGHLASWRYLQERARFVQDQERHPRSKLHPSGLVRFQVQPTGEVGREVKPKMVGSSSFLQISKEDTHQNPSLPTKMKVPELSVQRVK